MKLDDLEAMVARQRWRLEDPDGRTAMEALGPLIDIARAGKFLRDTYEGNDMACDKCDHVDCAVIRAFDDAFRKMEES